MDGIHQSINVMRGVTSNDNLWKLYHYVNVRIPIIADFGTRAAHVQVMTVLFCVHAGTTLESGY